MKTTNYLFFFASLFLVSCNGDDDSGNSGVSAEEFLPITAGNYWVYDVSDSTGEGRDSLYVDNDTIINNTTYKKFRTEEPAWGFYAGSMANNAVRYDGGTIRMSGTAAAIGFTGLPVDIEVSDFDIFNSGASANQVLETLTGTLEQDFEGMPLDIDYTLTSRAMADIDSYTVQGETYTNVKPVEITMNLAITAMVDFQGNTIPVTIMEAQDVITSTQYYAEGIGVVHVVTDFQYELSDLFAEQLPVPASGSDHQEEVLVDFQAE